MKRFLAGFDEMMRRDAIAKEPDMPVCVGCGWPSDDPELDLCCDCADAIFMKQILRGDFGAAEQQEARASKAAA